MRAVLMEKVLMRMTRFIDDSTFMQQNRRVSNGPHWHVFACPDSATSCHDICNRATLKHAPKLTPHLGDNQDENSFQQQRRANSTSNK